jgi:hypothetical protein
MCADTLNVMQWGQFLDHDLAHTPLFRLSNPNATGEICYLVREHVFINTERHRDRQMGMQKDRQTDTGMQRDASHRLSNRQTQTTARWAKYIVFR